MKIISSVLLSLGYEHWKQKMLENEKFRQENQMYLLAYEHEEPSKTTTFLEYKEILSLTTAAGAMLESSYTQATVSQYKF